MFGLLIVVAIVYGAAIFALADHVQDLLIANAETDRDLTDVEASLREHAQLRQELEDTRRQLGRLSVHVAALENRNLLSIEGGEGDVVYATGS